jgi:hypothetical protein
MFSRLVQAYNQEPVAITNLIIGAFQATLTLLVVFNLIQPTPEQTAGMMGFLGAFFALFNAIFVRSKVTPVANPKTDDGTPLLPAVRN